MQIDVFSSALIWIQRATPLPFQDKDGLVASAEGVEMRSLAITEERRAAVHDAVVEWANGLSPEARDVPADPLSAKGFLPVAQVLDAAKRQIALNQRILDAARLDDAGARRVRATQVVLVPVRTAPAEPR